MEIGFHNAHAYLEALTSHPTSYHAMRQKYPTLNPQRAAQDFQQALDGVLRSNPEEMKPAHRTLSELHGHYEEALTQLKSIASFKDGKWVPHGVGDAADDLYHLQEEFSQSEAELSQFLRGGEAVNGMRLSDRKLTEKFQKFERAVGDAHGVSNGWFGRLILDGPGSAVKQSLSEMKVWSAEAKGSRKIGFTKAAVCAGGAAAIGHAAFVGKMKDGEDRSAIGRVAEAGAGAAAIAGSLFYGKIR